MSLFGFTEPDGFLAVPLPDQEAPEGGGGEAGGDGEDGASERGGVDRIAKAADQLVQVDDSRRERARRDCERVGQRDGLRLGCIVEVLGDVREDAQLFIAREGASV